MSGGTRSRGPIASRSRRRETRGCGLHWTEDWGEHSYQHSHQGGSGLDRGASIKLSTSHQIRFRRDALLDLCEQSAAAGRVAPLLACDKSGLRLTFGEDMGHEGFEQPLHTRPGVSCHAQRGLVSRLVAPIGNRFHGMTFGCSAGVTTLGDVTLSLPLAKSGSG